MTKISSHCKRSLERHDFNRYDIVADGKLYRSEMSDARFQCFITQLIQTNDREVLDTFVNAIQNDLWEAIRKTLPKIARKHKLSKPVKELVKKLMKHEFSNAAVRGEAGLGYVLNFRNIANRIAGVSTTERFLVHMLGAYGTLKLNIPFNKWRVKSKTLLQGNQVWGETFQRTKGNADNTSFKDKQSYQGVEFNSELSILKRNSRFKFRVNGGLKKYWHPLADMLSSSIELGGLLTLRKPFNSRFSLTGTTKWTQERYSQPIGPAYNRRSQNKLESSAEATYLFKKIGLVLKYDYSDNNQVESFYSTREYGHAPTLLSHVVFRRGYIRLGGGAGVWDNSFQLSGEQKATRGHGAEAHGNIELQWRPKKWLMAMLKARGAANYSSGDYNGWFPSWSSEASLMLSLGKVFLKLAGGYSGHHRDLERSQTKHNGSAEATLAWRPSSRWNLALIGGYTATKQLGEQTYGEQSWYVQPAIGFRVFKNPDAWLSLGGLVLNYKYKQEDVEQDYFRIVGQLLFKLQF